MVWDLVWAQLMRLSLLPEYMAKASVAWTVVGWGMR